MLVTSSDLSGKPKSMWLTKEAKAHELQKLAIRIKDGSIDEEAIKHITKLNTLSDVVSYECHTGQDCGYISFKTSQKLGYYVESSIFPEFVNLKWATRCNKRMDHDDSGNLQIVYVIHCKVGELGDMVNKLVLRIELFKKTADPSALYL